MTASDGARAIAGDSGLDPEQVEQAIREGEDTPADLIRDERLRQVDEEGWTPEHDDQHEPFVLLSAASCYLDAWAEAQPAPDGWPWDESWWKPKDDRQRNLVRAGALALAEAERCERELTESEPYERTNVRRQVLLNAVEQAEELRAQVEEMLTDASTK